MVKMVKTMLNNEYQIIIPKHRADREEYHTAEGWERKRLHSMYTNIRIASFRNEVKPIVYYIGAEEGEMAALCQMWGAQVVLFEPNPKVWSSIRAIWGVNRLDKPAGVFAGFVSNVTQKAIKQSEYSDAMKIEDGWPRCSMDQIIAAHGFKELDKEADNFDQITIDDYVKKTGLIPTMLSIDVEGAEGRVIFGATETIQKYHPKIWLSGHPEFMLNNYGMYLRDLREVLKKEFGYKEELLDYDHEVHLFYHL